MKTLPTTQFITLYHQSPAEFPQLLIFDPSGERSSALLEKLVENADWHVDRAVDIADSILLHVSEDTIPEWRKTMLEREALFIDDFDFLKDRYSVQRHLTTLMYMLYPKPVAVALRTLNGYADSVRDYIFMSTVVYPILDDEVAYGTLREVLAVVPD